ncbi:hypothetical protein V6N13_036852 [Hibiscus sabdariffa]
MERNGNNGQHPVNGQYPPAPAGGAIVPPIPQNNQQQPIRTVRDYLTEDLEGLNPDVTIPEFEAEHFKTKTSNVQHAEHSWPIRRITCRECSPTSQVILADL